jgi:hypothetical protein
MAVTHHDSSLRARPARPWFRRVWYAAMIALAIARASRLQKFRYKTFRLFKKPVDPESRKF